MPPSPSPERPPAATAPAAAVDATTHQPADQPAGPPAASAAGLLRAGELAAVVAVQRRAGGPAVLRASQAASHFGDHAAGWLALGAVGWLLDRDRRPEWAAAGAAVLGAHATTVVVKRVLRRSRPHGAGVVVHARTPGRLSFPSSHAASSTAAAVAYGRLLGAPGAALVVAPLMGASRLVLGLHFPTDVAVGTAVGVAAGRLATRARGAAR